MAQWAKVFPSTADKIFVSQADSDSPTGFGLVEKSVSEMKTLLGLPSKIYKAFVNASGTSNPTTTVIKNTFTDTITIARQDVGVFTITSNSAEFTSNKTIAIAQPKTFLDPIVVGVSLSTSIISCYTYNDSDAFADSLDFWISIEVYD